MATPLPHSPVTVPLGEGVSTRVVDTGGSGTPVVLVHGLAASLELWDAVRPALAAHHRVVAFDLPGFGEASKPDAAYDPPFFVEQLRRLLAALGIGRAHLVGSSLGAGLVVRFAGRHPGVVERAVLADPGGFGPSIHPFLRAPTLPIVGGLLARPSRPATAFGVRLGLHDRALATPEAIDAADAASRRPGAHRAFVRTLRGVTTPLAVKDRASFAADARALTGPTLVVWGRQDRIFPVADAERAVAALPDARAVVLDGCGHFPPLERPDRFAALVLEHLAGGAG
jgi:pimeloyl-ACP methyl ester carboxylesterase